MVLLAGECLNVSWFDSFLTAFERKCLQRQDAARFSGVHFPRFRISTLQYEASPFQPRLQGQLKCGPASLIIKRVF